MNHHKPEMAVRNVVLVVLVLLFFYSNLTAQSSRSTFSDFSDKKITVANLLSINTEHLEFSPSYFQNGIVFISSRNQDRPIDKKINTAFFELFFAEFDQYGVPADAKEFSTMVNSRVHEGPVTFSADGKLMYFTRSNIKKGEIKADSKNRINLKIYEAKMGVKDWEEIKELPFNDDDYSNLHPSLSFDGSMLFFASDMPGGMGGTDLYMVEKNGAKWGEPVNLGPRINTASNEAFPFLHKSGTLFFSSRGHDSIGSYDIFKAEQKKKKWHKVVNLGEPFNTAKDDFGFIINEEGNQGFFSSSRDGGKGRDDIYIFYVEDNVPEPVYLNTELNIYDEKSNELLPDAAIWIAENLNGELRKNGEEFYIEDKGTEIKNYKLLQKGPMTAPPPDVISGPEGSVKYAFKEGHLYSILISRTGYHGKVVEHQASGSKMNPRINVPLTPDTINCAPLAIKVYNAETKKPIQGATVKIDNDCQSPSFESITNATGTIQYCIRPQCDFLISVQFSDFEIGHQAIRVPASYPHHLGIPLRPTGSQDAALSLMKKGTTITLEHIYYDLNKSTLQPEAAAELDYLYELMINYPSMEIELISHTDSRGGTRHNKQLSEKRAIAAKQYLVDRGIAPERITPVGMGETQLRNHCSDGRTCSEAEHQFNRRTEIRIIKLDKDVEIKYNEG